MTLILDVPGIGPTLASKLAEKGISTAEQFAATSPTALLEVPGIGARRVEILLEAAGQAVIGAPKGLPKSGNVPVQALASKAGKEARALVKDTAIADEVRAPAAPVTADKKTDKKKAAKDNASKKVKPKIKALRKEVKTRKSKVAHQRKKLEAAKKAKKAAVKKGNSREKNKKGGKSNKK